MYIYSMGRITTATKQPHCVSSYSLCPLTVNWQGVKGEGHAMGKVRGLMGKPRECNGEHQKAWRAAMVSQGV